MSKRLQPGQVGCFKKPKYNTLVIYTRGGDGGMNHGLAHIKCDRPGVEELQRAINSFYKLEHALKYTERQLISAKRVLFNMWQAVEDGQHDSRPYVGDTALSLRSALYGSSDETFYAEFNNWKINNTREEK